MNSATPIADKDERCLVYFLRKHDWSIARIAAIMEKSPETITQILAEPMPLSTQIYLPPHAGSVPQLRVRLVDEAQKIQIWLPPDSPPVPAKLLLTSIRETCTRLRIDASLTHEKLMVRMHGWVYGTWLTVLEAKPPQSDTAGRVKLLVPVKADGQHGTSEIVPVRAGEVLARALPGVAGTPGCDLLGRPLPVTRLPLPQFLCRENTTVSADGKELLATVDGQAIIRQGYLSVLPRTVHDGDLTGTDGRLSVQGGVIVIGSLREQAELVADGEVHVLGAVRNAQIGSVRRSIIVSKAVLGEPEHPAVLRAGEHIICGEVAFAELHTRGDIRVSGKIQHSRLTIGGDLYLPAPLDQCLVGVELALDGGIFVPVETFPPVPTLQPVRRHARVASTITGFLAPYDKPPMHFSPVVLANLSIGGARCRFPRPVTAAQIARTTVQLKFKLPDHQGDVVVIGHLVGVEPPLEVRIMFTQIAQRDVQRIARYCTT